LGVGGICCWNQRVAPDSNSCLGAQTVEFNVVLTLDNMKLTTCKKIIYLY
jgi:hypothetical protein